MRPFRPIALLVPLALVSLLTACRPPAAKESKAAPATLIVAQEDLRQLQLAELASGPIITGSIQPERRADLRAEVGAVVLQVLRENGESVRKGDLLVRLDDTSLRESSLSAQEGLRAARQAFEQAERTVSRLKTLQAQGMTSQQALEDAEVRRNQAQSDVVAAQARVSSAQQQLQRTEVRAPFDGVVSDRKASPGDTAQVGKELVKVIDPASLRFEGLVNADRADELKVGQRVNFRVNGQAQQDYVGRIKRVDVAANATTRQVGVIVALGEGQRPSVAGLFAEGRVETGSTQGLTVPDSALVRNGDEVAVWVVRQGKLQRQVIELAARDDRTGDFAVAKGLAEGDQVLRHPTSTLQAGQAVKLMSAKDATAIQPSASAASAAH